MAYVVDGAIYTHVDDIGHGNHKRIALGTRAMQDWIQSSSSSLASPIDRGLYDTLAENGQKGLVLYRNTPYLTGDSVLSYVAGVQPPRGQARYTDEFYGVLFMAGFSEFHPDPSIAPKVINYVVSYPLDDRRHRHDLKALFEGRWVWHTPNGKYDVTINECIPFPESSGAVACLSVGINGNKPDKFLVHSRDNPRQRGIFIDIGKETTQIGALGEEGEIIIGKHISIYDLGINTVLAKIKRAFESSTTHNKLIKKMRGGLSPAHLSEILREGVFSNGGETVDCSGIVKTATTQLVNAIENAISNLTNWDVQYGCIAGGGAIDAELPLATMLSKHIHNLSDNVKKVLPDNELIYGTVRGNALNTMLIWQEQRGSIHNKNRRK